MKYEIMTRNQIMMTREEIPFSHKKIRIGMSIKERGRADKGKDKR